MNILDSVFLGNSLSNWLIFGVIFFISYGILFFITRVGMRLLANALRRSERFKESKLYLDDLIRGLRQKTNQIVLGLIAIYISSQVLILPENIEEIIKILALVALIIQIAQWCVVGINYWVNQRVSREEDTKQAAEVKTTMNAIRLVLLVALWSIIVLAVLAVVTGVTASSLLATLGIAGVAVALAVQNILGDLFSSLSIALDKPFVIGDAISVDGSDGTVEHIGLKSTRVRSIDGEQLVFSNSFILDNRLKNYSSQERRRVVLNLIIDYKTPSEKLAHIPEIAQKVVENKPEVTFSRAIFKQFVDCGAQFEIIFFIENYKLERYLEVLQEVNQEIFQQLEKEGIRFADCFHQRA